MSYANPVHDELIEVSPIVKDIKELRRGISKNKKGERPWVMYEAVTANGSAFKFFDGDYEYIKNRADRNEPVPLKIRYNAEYKNWTVDLKKPRKTYDLADPGKVAQEHAGEIEEIWDTIKRIEKRLKASGI